MSIRLKDAIAGHITGNANTATTLQNTRAINGTNFNGSGNITTEHWGKARNVKIGNTSRSVNGSGDVTWSLGDIGAASSSHTHNYAGSSSAGGAATTALTCTGNSATATTSNYLASNSRMEYGWDGVNYFNISGTAGNTVKTNNTPSTAWWHIMRFNHANSNGYYTDLAIPFNDTSLHYKRVTAGSVQNGGWVKVLDALNYNSYAPTKTGGGASGTWGISISGNAATATKWSTGRWLTVGNTRKGVDGTGDVTWTLSEIGAAPASHTHSSLVHTNEATASITTKDHGDHTWFRNSSGAWTFQSGTSGDDWTQSFQISLPAAGSTANANWMEIGQQKSNAADGRYRGISLVKYTGSKKVAGDLSVGDVLGTGSKTAFRLSTDSWLRINDTGSYSSGVYFGSSTLRTDGRFEVLRNNVTWKITNENSSFTHYSTSAPEGHWFNKVVKVAGEIYAGTNYNQRVYHEGYQQAYRGYINELLTNSSTSSTIDLSGSTYDQATYYPVVGSALHGRGYTEIRVAVQLNSGSKPTWSTHNSGFSANFHLLTKAGGWGTVDLNDIVLDNSYKWTNVIPIGYSQMSNSSYPVLWLRGGGKYFVCTSDPMTWTIKTAAYTANSQTVTPTTTYPGVNISKATITANLNGTAATLATPRSINGTSFNGSSDITTANWGAARTLTIGNTGKSVNGSGNVNWTLNEIGAASSSHTHSYLPLGGGTVTGRLTANGKISVPTTGSTWLSGKTLTNASIAIATKQTTESYHPILAVQTSSNHVVNIGGLGDYVGFYGYKADRTANGTDWNFVFNSSNGNVVSSGAIDTPILNITSANGYRHSQLGAGDNHVIGVASGIVYLGNPQAKTQIEGNSNPTVLVGNNKYTMYHTGNKPTPAEIGAIPNSKITVSKTAPSNPSTGDLWISW